MGVYCLGFSPAKRALLRRFTGRCVRPLTPGRCLGASDALFVWGAAEPPPETGDAEVTYVEDGFLRSSGLGAAFAEPMSWCFDRGGQHYDASRATDLERLLAGLGSQPEVLRRAAELRERIVAAGITKYNVGSGRWTPQRPQGRSGPTILVVGQVAGDAALDAIRTPARTNMALLRAVRAEAPDAWIVYKRHPDVAAGLRDGDDGDAVLVADEVVETPSLPAMLPHVDAVHVLTSLSGFEALLRGARVVCHAQPFYSGWGLTEDRQPIPRRSRRLTLDELVAGALVLYPRYRLPGAARPCSVEAVAEHLAAPPAPGLPARTKARVLLALGRLRLQTLRRARTGGRPA